MNLSACIASTAVVLGVVIWPAFGIAQSIDGSGVKGGLSVAKLRSFDAFGVLEWREAFSGGGFVTIGFGETFALQPEVLYVPKGLSFGTSEAVDESGSPRGTFESFYAFDYLEIPVLVRATVPVSGRVHPHFFAGPTLGILLSQKLRVTGSRELETDLDIARKADLGITTGFGVEIDMGPGRWIVDGRYTQGLTNALNSGELADAQNSAFLMMTGYSF